MTAWVYLSLSGPDGFIGGAFVRGGGDRALALARARASGIVPDEADDALVFDVPPEEERRIVGLTDRLLSLRELEEYDSLADVWTCPTPSTSLGGSAARSPGRSTLSPPGPPTTTTR
jgi:hypothetical protein